jgi:hypothetical protein
VQFVGMGTAQAQTIYAGKRPHLTPRGGTRFWGSPRNCGTRAVPTFRKQTYTRCSRIRSTSGGSNEAAKRTTVPTAPSSPPNCLRKFKWYCTGVPLPSTVSTILPFAGC